MITPSSSFPDLKAYNGPNANRIPRKPPPTIDMSERYPSPDPSDPFAPLWVLRNRTSSALLPRTCTPLPPYSGPYGSQETLNNLGERRRSNSYLYSSPSSTAIIHQPDVSLGDTDSFTGYNTISPPGSPLKATKERPKPKPKATPKIGHYTPYSQMHQRGVSPVGTLQAFPRISTPLQSQTDIELASPRKLQRPWSAVPDHQTSRSPQYRADAGMKYHHNNSASDTETDDDLEAYIRPSSSELKPSVLIRPHTAQDYSEPLSRINANSSHQRAQSVHANTTHPPKSTQSRFAKFLLPRKISFLRSGGSASRPASMEGAAGRRSSTAQSRPVSKASISSPQAMMSTVFLDSSSMNNANGNSYRGRLATTPITPVQKWADEMNSTNTTDARTDHMKDSDDGQKKPHFLVSSMMTKSLSLDTLDAQRQQQRGQSVKPSWIRKEMLEKTNSESEKKPNISSDRDFYSRTHLRRVLHPLTISKLTDKSNSDDDHFVTGSEKKRYSLDIDGYRPTQKKAEKDGYTTKKRTTSFFHVLNMASRPRTLVLHHDMNDADIGPVQEPSGARPATTGSLQVTDDNLTVRSSAFLPLSPVEPSANSTSGTSVANISVSTPSFASNPSEDERAYTSPRPAPRPPVIIKPLFISKKKSKTTTKDDIRSGIMGSQNGSGSGSIVTVDRTTTPTSNLACKLPPASPPVSNLAGSKVAVNDSTPFSFPTEWTLPTPPQITFAASLPLTSEDGTHISFGSLFSSTRTIVIFIRHFWCPLCQDYMTSLKSLVRPEMLAEWPKGTTPDEENLRERLVKFVVISNGAHGMIQKYRQMFGLPFRVYTDPALAVYRALGLGRDGDDCQHPNQHQNQQRNHSFYQYQQQQLRMRQKSFLGQTVPVGVDETGDDEGDATEGVVTVVRKSGGYVKHSVVGGFAMVVVRAIKVGMPVWEKGGDVGQLGGEFIFGPGLTCTYAHRMQTTRGHAPIEDVLTAAGIDVSGLSKRTSEDASLRSESTKAGSVTGPNNILIKDLPSLPKAPSSPTTKEVAPQHHRRRLSSLKNLKDTLSLNRAASVASALSVSLVHRNVNGGGVSVNGTGNVVEGEQSKRNTRHYSMGFFGINGGMMSQEEEERWMESRQQSIERLKEKKNVRRGIARSRTVSAHSCAADVVVIEPERMSESALPSIVVDESGYEHEEGESTPQAKQNQRIGAGKYWERRDDLEGVEAIGEMDEHSDNEHDDTAEMVEEDSRRSLDSFSDTASSWSRSTAPPHDGGSYVFMHDAVL